MNDKAQAEESLLTPPPEGCFNYFKYLLTRHSEEGNSFAANFGRNVLYNFKDFIHYLHFKITEPSSYSPKKLHYDIIDLYKTVEEDPLLQTEEDNSKPVPILEKLRSFFTTEQTWILLMLLGTFAGMMAIFLESSVSSFVRLRNWLVESTLESCGENQYCNLVGMLVYVLFCTSFCMLSALVVRFVSPQAAGSGLPELKSILSGVVLPRYLNYRTFLAKTVGLIFVLSGGLSVGREAPFVLISGIIANKLAKIQIFAKSRTSEAKRFRMLSAGSAAGVSCIFGAPIGGVLFSIEVTTTYFLVQNLWRAFFCSVMGALTVKLAGATGLIAMFATNFNSETYRIWELIIFIFMGLTFGYAGSLFVRLVLKMVYLRRDYKILAETKYIQLIVVAILTSVLIYPFKTVREQVGTDEILNDLFGTDPNSMADWESRNIYFSLAAFVVAKFLLTAVSLGLPVPCGLYTPVFLMGAVAGRLVGEIVAFCFADGYITPAGYAVVGAAAMSAGTTRTLSTAVIVFELTGQLEFLIPVLLATICAIAVGNKFSAGAYDALLEYKALPYMAPFGNLRMPKDMTTAESLMKTNLVYVCTDANYNDITELLDAHNYQSYPIVEPDTMILKGSVTRRALVTLWEERDSRFRNAVEAEFLNNLSQVSTREDTIQRLKNRYKFSEKPLPDGDTEESVVTDEEDYSVLEQTLAEKRKQFFNIPVMDDINRLSRADFDESPFQAPEATHFYQIHVMFAMLGINHAFITRNGCLVGVITKKDFFAKTRHLITWA